MQKVKRRRALSAMVLPRGVVSELAANPGVKVTRDEKYDYLDGLKQNQVIDHLTLENLHKFTYDKATDSEDYLGVPDDEIGRGVRALFETMRQGAYEDLEDRKAAQAPLLKYHKPMVDALRRGLDIEKSVGSNRRDLDEQKINLNAQKRAIEDRTNLLKATLAWMQDYRESHTLHKNTCSRAHKIDMPNNEQGASFREAMVFVVQHDWAGVLGKENLTTDVQLPYDNCVFEFRVNEKNIIMHVTQGGEGANVVLRGFWIETLPDQWYAMSYEDEQGCLDQDMTDSMLHADKNTPASFAYRQLFAACIVMEAEAATTTIERAPAALNKKRASKGKQPLRDFHIIDLAKRHQRTAGHGVPSDRRRPRLHFRSGHWRHLPNKEKPIRIKWMLVGNADLGFVNKEYRL